MLQDAAAHAPETRAPEPWAEPVATALLVLADGTILEGFGIGQTGVADGEVCFNTAMTGYQEILTDPSYAARSSPLPSRISAMSALTTRIWRAWRRRRPRACAAR